MTCLGSDLDAVGLVVDVEDALLDLVVNLPEIDIFEGKKKDRKTEIISSFRNTAEA